MQLPFVDEQPGAIAERFVTFHETNPDVYTALVAHTRELVALGHQRVGIGMLWEVLRWSHMRTGDPTSDFKLNNDYRSHYASRCRAVPAGGPHDRASEWAGSSTVDLAR